MADPAFDISFYKTALRSGDVAVRTALAADASAPPEILCFLATDGAAEVRRAVAENPATPNQADLALSRDPDVTVRCLLARKLVGDGLEDGARQQLWRMGFTILETLMRDRVVQVRRVLSAGFCRRGDAPPDIVAGLAFDTEEDVAAPVLSLSPVLTDKQMIGYLRNGAPVWAQAAMAGRKDVSADLGRALTETAAPEALTALAANQRAAIAPESMDVLVDRARTAPKVQEPLVRRKDLSGSAIVKLAKFVAAPLLGVLCNRKDIDAATAKRMNRAIETRKDDPKIRAVTAGERTEAAASSGKTAKENDRKVPVRPLSRGEAPSDRAARLHDAGSLTDDAIALALDTGENDFVIAALALRADFPEERVRRMVDVDSPRTMVALAWKAGLSARFAMNLQRQLAGISHRKVINARDGLDFALSKAEMAEQLALFD